MEKRYKIIDIIGQSGCGKDTVLNETVTRHPDICARIINCTTRPMRDYEEDGVDYHFIPVSGFTREVLNGNMLEATEYNDWFYGTNINALTPNKINIGIFSPAAVEALLQDPRLDVDVVRVVTANKTRLQRSLNREDVPDCTEICRRYLADEKDFADLDFDYWVIENYEGTRLECLDLFYCSNSLDILDDILKDL